MILLQSLQRTINLMRRLIIVNSKATIIVWTRLMTSTFLLFIISKIKVLLGKRKKKWIRNQIIMKKRFWLRNKTNLCFLEFKEFQWQVIKKEKAICLRDDDLCVIRTLCFSVYLFIFKKCTIWDSKMIKYISSHYFSKKFGFTISSA